MHTGPCAFPPQRELCRCEGGSSSAGRCGEIQSRWRLVLWRGKWESSGLPEQTASCYGWAAEARRYDEAGECWPLLPQKASPLRKPYRLSSVSWILSYQIYQVSEGSASTKNRCLSVLQRSTVGLLGGSREAVLAVERQPFTTMGVYLCRLFMWKLRASLCLWQTLQKGEEDPLRKDSFLKNNGVFHSIFEKAPFPWTEPGCSPFRAFC